MGHGMWVPRMTLLEMLGSGEKSSLLESLTGCVTSGKSQNPSGLTDVHSGSGERNWTPPREDAQHGADGGARLRLRLGGDDQRKGLLAPRFLYC